jgi:hypothetical protein
MRKTTPLMKKAEATTIATKRMGFNSGSAWVLVMMCTAERRANSDHPLLCRYVMEQVIGQHYFAFVLAFICCRCELSSRPRFASKDRVLSIDI